MALLKLRCIFNSNLDPLSQVPFLWPLTLPWEGETRSTVWGLSSSSEVQFNFSLSALNARALYHKEMLCKKDEVQRFLSSLVLKPPEVGHLVNCFHIAKLAIEPKKKGAQSTPIASKDKGGPQRKVITFRYWLKIYCNFLQLCFTL